MMPEYHGIDHRPRIPSSDSQQEESYQVSLFSFRGLVEFLRGNQHDMMADERLAREAKEEPWMTRDKTARRGMASW